jgi:hypothetical protein
MTIPMRPPLPSDPDAAPSEEELREAEALRRALDDPSVPHEGAALARAVVLAYAPRPLDADEHRALVDVAMRAPAVVALPMRRSRKARTFGWVSAGVGTLALAAAVLLMVRPQPDRMTTQAVALHEARTTQPLFREPFAERGGGSRRIDRIASARASDLRENRYARWAVQ